MGEGRKDRLSGGKLRDESNGKELRMVQRGNSFPSLNQTQRKEEEEE